MGRNDGMLCVRMYWYYISYTAYVYMLAITWRGDALLPIVLSMRGHAAQLAVVIMFVAATHDVLFMANAMHVWIGCSAWVHH